MGTSPSCSSRSRSTSASHFPSLLIDAGVNPKAIQEFTGDATIEETFSRYGHLMLGTRNQARELVDAHMDPAAA